VSVELEKYEVVNDLTLWSLACEMVIEPSPPVFKHSVMSDIFKALKVLK
jgi:hypothetical protein